MKKCLLIYLFLSFCTVILAQDIIHKKDGTSVKSNVLEIGTNEVKYKKWENPNGPTYTISLSIISFIRYQNGQVDTFNKEENNEQEFIDVRVHQPYQETNIDYFNRKELLKSYHRHRNWAIAIAIIGVGSAVPVTILAEQNQWLPITWGAISLSASIYLWKEAENKRKQAYSIQTVSFYKHTFNLGCNNLTASFDVISNNLNKERSFGIGLNLLF